MDSSPLDRILIAKPHRAAKLTLFPSVWIRRMTTQIDLPAPAAATMPVPAARSMPTLNALLALVVLAFAGLVASFAARNTDVWRHLAAGRLLAQLNYRFGNDPFAYTTQGVYWA